MDTPRDDLIGHTLGNCTLERLVGQGGMGSVYLARQDRPARNVAVKVLFPNITHKSELYQQFLARFRREADVIARLEHVNIMPIYAYGEQDGMAYLVMPYLSGGSLRDIVARNGALPPQMVANYLDQAASALDYAHSQGVIHRDLKPANFLLHSDGRLVLADFGIARMIQHMQDGNTLTATGMLLGTPEYMAPEMAKGGEVDYRADIYELGIVLYQMLNGRVPFSGTTPYAVAIRHIQEPLHPLSATSLPEAFNAILQKATAKQPADRYTSVQEMTRQFHQAIGGTPLPDDQENIKTVASAPPPATSPSPEILTQTPLPTQVARRDTQTLPPTVSASWPHYPTFQTLPPAASPRRQNPLLLGISIAILAILLLLVGLLVPRLLTPSSPGTTSASTATPIPTATMTAGPTATPVPTVTATAGPTATPVPTGIPTTASTYPTGTQLYTTNAPLCDDGSHSWTQDSSVKVDCQSDGTHVSYTGTGSFLEGIFLQSLPDQSYPNNYVVQGQVQNGASAGGSFGLYFRNQPGKTQFGVYVFLVNPDGSWEVNVYDNASGNATKLTGGQLPSLATLQTIAVEVQGTQFTFFANNQRLDSISDSTYSSGTTGIAVDQGASIVVDTFTLSTVPA